METATVKNAVDVRGRRYPVDPRIGVGGMKLHRRGPGEGSIYQRGDGRWVSYLRLPDGRKKFYSGRTRRQVQDRLDSARDDQRRGHPMVGRDQELGRYLGEWLEGSVRPSVRPKTWEDYDLCVRRLLPLLGTVRLRALTPERLQLAYARLLERGLSARTVAQTHMVVRRALKQAVLWRLLPYNPSDGVKAPRAARPEVRVLDEDEVRHLLAASDVEYRALWALLVTSGMRIGEALGLRWTDLDQARSMMTIRRAVQRQRAQGLVFVEPKTARSRRTVPVPAAVIEMLAARRGRTDADGLVFSRADGRPLDPTWVSACFRRELDRLGLPRVRLHDLRHTAATHLLTTGVHPKVVQDLLGHSTIAITLDTYSHVLPPLAREASSHMASLLPPRLSAAD